MRTADFYKGELRAFRLIAEDLQSFGIITDDELKIVWSLVSDVVERMDNEVKE